MAIALEHNGAEMARPFIEQAGVTFPAFADETGVSSASFGFKAVPNGVLIDEDGTIQWAKYGGFSIDNADDVDVVRRFLSGERVEPSTQPEYPYQLGEDDSVTVERLTREARGLADRGDTAAAVDAWRAALRLDPQNLVIRKQIWEAEHPEKFHPVIDYDWQKVQLQKERDNEIARGICGPDGCPVPSMGGSGPPSTGA